MQTSDAANQRPAHQRDTAHYLKNTTCMSQSEEERHYSKQLRPSSVVTALQGVGSGGTSDLELFRFHMHHIMQLPSGRNLQGTKRAYVLEFGVQRRPLVHAPPKTQVTSAVQCLDSAYDQVKEGHTRTRLQRGSAHGADAAAAMEKWKDGLHAKPINGIPQLLSKSDVHDWNAACFTTPRHSSRVPRPNAGQCWKLERHLWHIRHVQIN